MDKIDALFIRAIKGRSPEFRIKRLYEKFYHHEFKAVNLASVLSGIIRDYSIMDTNDWIDSMNPDNRWKYVSEDTELTYHEFLCKVFESKIWGTPYSKFGFTYEEIP